MLRHLPERWEQWSRIFDEAALAKVRVSERQREASKCDHW